MVILREKKADMDCWLLGTVFPLMTYLWEWGIDIPKRKLRCLPFVLELTCIVSMMSYIVFILTGDQEIFEVVQFVQLLVFWHWLQLRVLMAWSTIQLALLVIHTRHGSGVLEQVVEWRPRLSRFSTLRLFQVKMFQGRKLRWLSRTTVWVFFWPRIVEFEEYWKREMTICFWNDYGIFGDPFEWYGLWDRFELKLIFVIQSSEVFRGHEWSCHWV